MNNITMKVCADELIMSALREDITGEDITTNSVMRDYALGEVDLICKQDGVACGLGVFERVFKLLDERTEVSFTVKDGDEIKKGQKIAQYVINQIEYVETEEITELSTSNRGEGGFGSTGLNKNN